MVRWIACWVVLLVAGVSAGEMSAPHWIAPMDKEAATATLGRGFTVDGPLQSATLKFAADFCFATVTINEKAVLEVAPFVQLQTLDVTDAVQRGENLLRVELREANQLTGVALTLELRYASGAIATVATDQAWSLVRREESGALKLEPSTTEKPLVEDRGAVAHELWGIGRRDISLSAYENYEQWQQSKGEVADKNRPKFWLAPGFEITEVRVAQPDEGSWIAMAFDDKGRLTISREDVGLLRMTLAEDRKSVSKVEHVDVKLEECRGLAYEGQTLYANANNSKALFRLKIDDEGKAQDVTRLREFPGGVGHGRNDIALQKDPKTGKLSIYSILGDSVDLPVGEDVEDHTSPLRETKLVPPKKEGSLIQMDIEDGNVVKTHILHAGLRNPYGIAINRFGDPFTFDADNEHDMGTPWYRPTRILQLVSGGDSGYREVTGHLPPRFHDQPDHAPQLFDIGRSSPTSVMFGYDLKFPEPYKQALFALDWTYGRVIAVHLAPRGMTYRANAETFLQGHPLNVTDIATGPDRAMYLTTGGRKTQSALYRIVNVAGESLPRSFHEMYCLQQFILGGPSSLDKRDPVAGHILRKISDRLDDLFDQEHSDHLLNALRRQEELVDPILTGMLNDPDFSVTHEFTRVRILNLCLETSRERVLAQRDKLVPLVVAVWKALDSRPYSVAPIGTSVELRRRLAYLLGELGADELPKLAGEKLLVSGVQEDQIAGLLALRNQKTGWTLELRKQQFQTINSIPQMIGGAGLPPLEKWLREESIKTLHDAEKSLLGDLLQPKSPEPEPLPPPRPLVQKWTLDALAALHGNGLGPRAEGLEPEGKDGPTGDVERGRIIFRDALCSRCHRVGIRGAAVGPDLTFVGRRFSRRDMLESVLSPNLSVAEQYRQEAIETHSGQTHIGRIIPEGDYRKETLRLALDPLDASKVIEIDKKEIAEHKSVPTSPMPSGLLDTFTIEEIRDLLAFLESGGK